MSLPTSVAPAHAQRADQTGEVRPLARRLAALDKAVALLDGRIGEGQLRSARQASLRVSERLALSPAHTVVALAGATGSGKSSLFNHVVGLELSAVGARRPVTGAPHACLWGPDGAGPLLDWLGIPRHNQTARETALDADSQVDLRGLVLLDLPDHDSTELAHRLEVDRLVELVDLLIWVVDPQKYADEAVHTRYLRPLSRHAGVTVVALNQVDLLEPDEVTACRDDLRRLLDADGLRDARLIETSAVRGDGMAGLRDLLTGAVAVRRAALQRLDADLDAAVADLTPLAGPEMREDVDRRSAKRLYGALASAAGVTAVGEAVERGYRFLATRHTSWPVARWLGRSRRDPLKGVHRRADPDAVPAPPDPTASPVQRAKVESALRELTETTTRGMPAPWPEAVYRAARSELETLPGVLEDAVDGADLGLGQRPWWWRAAQGTQTGLAFAMFGGAVWLLGLSASAAAGLGLPSTPVVGSLALPAVLVLVGLAGGPLVALAGRSLAKAGGRYVRARAETAVRDAVTAVARERVLAPVRAELGSYAQVREALLDLGVRAPAAAESGVEESTAAHAALALPRMRAISSGRRRPATHAAPDRLAAR